MGTKKEEYLFQECLAGLVNSEATTGLHFSAMAKKKGQTL